MASSSSTATSKMEATWDELNKSIERLVSLKQVEIDFMILTKRIDHLSGEELEIVQKFKAEVVERNKNLLEK